MDTAVKQSDKENSKPDAGPRKPESQNVTSKQKLVRTAALRSKNAGDAAETKTHLKPSNDPNPAQKKTLSQAFRTQQTLRHRKLVLETQKPPSSVPPKPLLPGTYKGKVFQSKIDCFRKPPSGAEKNPSEIKTKDQTAFRSKSATSSRAGVQARVESRTKSGPDGRGNLQKLVPQRPISTKAPARTASVSSKPSFISTKPSTISTKPSTISTKPSSISTKPSTKPSSVFTKPSSVSTKPSSVSTKPSFVSTKPSTISTKSSIITKPSTTSRKPVTMSAKPPPVTSFIKKKDPSKPASAASEQKPLKSTTSSIRQYRVRVESTEERQLKLAEWLASKGKTLKRPAMAEKSATQSCRPPPCADQLSGEAEAQPEVVTSITADQTDVPQSKPAFSSSPSHILNITLDLLDNSDTEPAEPEIRMETLVMNLCERLEAMEAPSSSKSETRAEGNAASEVKLEEKTPEYEILEEEELTALEKKEEDGEEEKKTLESEEEGDGEEEKKTLESEDEEEKMNSTPDDDLDACVVKYSVKTTPFLQSVKKRMGGEMVPGTPGSRCKSSIKELKFLTPVRRSSRIHRNSSRLPGMLNEHDPCVSSLAELEVLDASDSNAYIYRKNPALLQHLPDHSSQ